MSDLLWVYGTLLSPIGSGFGEELAKKGKLLGPGWARGRLYDLGNYPAFAFDEENGERIRGEVWHLSTPESVWPVLDPYENYEPERPEKENLYVRELHPVETPDGEAQCWIYTYHGQLSGLPIIPDFDYFSFWRKNLLHQRFTRQ